jgi:hypothetical protein
MALPDVTAAKARVFTREKGIASNLDITIAQGANIASVTQESSRIVVDTIQTELGLPVSGLPTVRIGFGGAKLQPVASSVVRSPQPEMEPAAMMGSTDDAAPSEPAVMDPLEGTDPAAPTDISAEGTDAPEPTSADTPLEGRREDPTPGW